MSALNPQCPVCQEGVEPIMIDRAFTCPNCGQQGLKTILVLRKCGAVEASPSEPTASDVA